MHPSAPVPPHHDRAPRSLPWSTLSATVILTVVAIVVGQRDWALPERVRGGFEVAAVPSSLTALLLASTAICLLVGGWATLRDAALRPRDPAFVGWVVVSLLAAAALIWNALFMAADAEFETGAIIPVFHWLFTFVPPLLVGLIARRRGRAPALVAALATGTVTLPLFGLGWSLLASRDPAGSGIGSSLWNTTIFGVVPLVLATLIVRSNARDQKGRI